jgi:hypothetical protein
MSWQQYVQLAQSLGFTKVTIIQRADYQTAACTSAADIATAWKDGDKQVNENQELLDDWKDAKKMNFCFYGKRFNIVLRDDEDGNWIVCVKGQEICIARQFTSIWFVVYGEIAKKSVKKDDKAEQKAGFKSAPDAFTKVCNDIFDKLEEAGV